MPSKEPEFLSPSPEKIFIGETPLREYLVEAGLGWVIRIRELLEMSDLSKLTAGYQRKGRHAIHPVVMLGLIVYGILQRQWSLRELEKLASRDVAAWWLCGGLRPDHSTIGKFIRMHAEVLSEEYFVELTKMLATKLKLTSGSASCDGTVIEAAGSHYKTLQEESAKLAAREAQEKAEAQPQDQQAQDVAQRAQQVAQRAVERADKRRQKGKDPKSTRVCVTEPEAVVQPLKNGARRPSYKPSVLADSNRLIVGKHLHPSDETAAVAPMLEQHRAIFGGLPDRLMLDAGYHNYVVLGMSIELDLDVLCPSGKADRGQWEKKNGRKQYPKDRFKFDPEADRFICPQGEELTFLRRESSPSGGAFKKYRCNSCDQCPRRSECTTSKNGRTINRYASDELKECMAEVFRDERARLAYGQRKAHVEPVFGELREGQGLTRFHRHGLAGAGVEYSLHCIAYNLMKAQRIEFALLICAAPGPSAGGRLTVLIFGVFVLSR